MRPDLLARRALRGLRPAATRVLGHWPVGLGPAVVTRQALAARSARVDRTADLPAGAQGAASVSGLLARAHAQLAAGDRAGAAGTMRTLATRRPLWGGAGDVAADLLVRLGDESLVELFLGAPAWSRRSARLRHLRDELALARAADDGPQALASAVADLAARSARWRTAAAAALSGAHRWDDLARTLDGHPTRAAWPSAEALARHARDAAREGYLSASVTLGRHALVLGAGTATAELVARSRDQLELLEQGWERETVGSTPYEPEPTAVLSVLSQSLPIRSGGYATRTHGLLTGLARRGWAIEAITRLGFPYDRWPADDAREVPARDEVDGIGYRRSLVPGRRRYPQVPLRHYTDQFAADVVEAATDHRAAVVHASSFYATGLGAAAAARRLGLPFVYEMRGLEDLMSAAKHPGFVGTEGFRFHSWVETEVCLQADAVLVITQALLEEMVRRGVPRERLSVVPNGVHIEDFSPLPRDEALAAELGLGSSVVLGYAGSLVHYEGLELLVEATELLVEAGHDVTLLVVGDGPHDAQVRAAAARSRVGDRIRFTGRVPHDQVVRYLSLFDITPFPRLPLEVCELISPIKPFEAMATAKAVVVSDVAALTEIVTDGVSGLTFAKGDAADLARALAELVVDPDLRARLGAQAREWVATERRWETITGVVDAVYRDLLAR